MIINHNMGAINAHRQMTANTTTTQKSTEKLSSGLRINRAADDAAGLSISEKMRGQIRGLDQASRNAQDGISMIQTAEGALDEVHSITQRMRELTVQAANDTNIEADRTAIQQEFAQLNEELVRIKDTTQFNKQNLLDSTAGAGGNGKVKFHIGANSTQSMEVDFSTAGVNLTDICTELGNVDISAQGASFDDILDTIDAQIESVSSGRSYLGAVQNRLEHTIKNLDNASENLTSAESQIRDVDMAKEMMTLTKMNVLTQASQAMLAQANQRPNQVLSLLQ